MQAQLQPLGDFGARRRPLRIALADDDPRMRYAVAEILRMEGNEVEELADGQELLAHVAGAIFTHAEPAGVDLVVSDVHMPRLGGLEVLRRIRVVCGPLPVLLMTADPDPSFRRQVANLGGALLEKPFSCEALHEVVRKLTNPARSSFVRRVRHDA